MTRWLASLVVGSVMLLGCGSVKNDNPDGGGGDDAADTSDFTLSVTPTSSDVSILGSTTVTVTIARTGTIGEIDVTASGSTTITADAATIAADATSTDLTITLNAGTTTGSTDLTISGTDGTRTHEATVTITAKPIPTVSGKVRGNRNGIFVGIVGKTPTSSAADGTFSFTDVTPPYDLYTYFPASGADTTFRPAQVYYYRGLSTDSPFVSAGTSNSGLIIPGFAASATVNGTLSGPNLNLGARKLIAWGNASGNTTVTSGASYSLTAAWRYFGIGGSGSGVGTLHALNWTTRTTGAPDVFLGYGATQGSFANNSTNTVNVTLNAVSTATLSGTISVPAGFPAPTLTLRTLLNVGTVPSDLWVGSTTNAAATIPLITGAKVHLKASSTTGGAITSLMYPDLAADTDVTFALPAPVRQVTPVVNATAVSATTAFQLELPTTPQVTVVTLNSNAAIYYMFTDASSFTIPVVDELPLPAATSFTWKVEGFGPATGVNGAALEAPPEDIYDTDFAGAMHFYTTSPERIFTSN